MNDQKDKLKEHLEHLDDYEEIAPEEFREKETRPGPTPQGRPGDYGKRSD